MRNDFENLKWQERIFFFSRKSTLNFKKRTNLSWTSKWHLSLESLSTFAETFYYFLCSKHDWRRWCFTGRSVFERPDESKMSRLPVHWSDSKIWRRGIFVPRRSFDNQKYRNAEDWFAEAGDVHEVGSGKTQASGTVRPCFNFFLYSLVATQLNCSFSSTWLLGLYFGGRLFYQVKFFADKNPFEFFKRISLWLLDRGKKWLF